VLALLDQPALGAGGGHDGVPGQRRAARRPRPARLCKTRLLTDYKKMAPGERSRRHCFSGTSSRPPRPVRWCPLSAQRQRQCLMGISTNDERGQGAHRSAQGGCHLETGLGSRGHRRSHPESGPCRDSCDWGRSRPRVSSWSASRPSSTCRSTGKKGLGSGSWWSSADGIWGSGGSEPN
jgi:hypothetical protein